jgi:hypothetical protein
MKEKSHFKQLAEPVGKTVAAFGFSESKNLIAKAFI